MKTNTNAYRALIRAHILQGLTDYAGPDTERDKARHIWAMFCSQADYRDNRRRTPNTQDRVAEWLAGLPLNIATYNFEILEFYEYCHSESIDGARADRILANWFSHVAFHLLAMWRDAGIDPMRPGAQGCTAAYA